MSYIYLDNKPKHNLLLVLSILSLLLLLLQLGLSTPKISQIVADQHFSQQILLIPAIVIPSLLWTLTAHLLIWAALVILIWGITRLCHRFFDARPQQELKLGITLWLLSLIVIITANQLYFPQSTYAEISSHLFSPLFAKLFLYGSLLALAFYSIVATIQLVKNAGYLLIPIALFFIYFAFASSGAVNNDPKHPNIFIIGIDSLRPDHISYYGAKEHLTPNLDDFLKHATNFSHAVTPLNRTFPAWVSILSGQYPRKNGIRYDLSPLRNIKKQQLLPKILHNQGYRTIYASDDTRLNNIDEQFGFETIIGPNMGYNERLLSFLNDFPLSNLVMNTTIGAWLFPHNYANRGSHVNYLPKSFNGRLRRSLRQNGSKPLFLTVRFGLAHPPYLWATTPADETHNKDNYQQQKLYAASLRAVDKQFSDLISTLRKQKLLENSIVVVLTDHGGSINFEKDNFLTARKYVSPLRTRRFHRALQTVASLVPKTHDIEVLYPRQYHVLLAIRQFGSLQNKPSMVDLPVSLVDVMPTLLDQIGQAAPHDIQGYSLKNFLYQSNTQYDEKRPIFLESGISQKALAALFPKSKRSLDLDYMLYQVSPSSGKMSVRGEFDQVIIQNKQRAIIYDGWLLALYPAKQANKRILVNLKSHRWTDKMSSNFAKNSPAKDMLQYLRNFYHGEIKRIV